MNYSLEESHQTVQVSIEESFTLIDFIMLTISLLIGTIFMMIFYMFTFAVIVKVFTRHEYSFDSDSYEMTQYFRIFNFLSVRRRKIGYGEIKEFLFSNRASGTSLNIGGLESHEWYSLDLILDNEVIRMTKVEEDELDDLDMLYTDLKESLDTYFSFNIDWVS